MSWVRSSEIALAVKLAESGVSIDLVGGRGSGRTTFLHELGQRLEARGRQVLTISGVASLRQHPLAALQLAGVPMPTEGVPSVSVIGHALQKQLAVRRSVLLVDNWDDLDESSWGLLDWLGRANAVTMVQSRLRGRRARHTPSGLDATTGDCAYRLELRPLSFDQLEAVVTGMLDGPVEADTMSRIYAKTGGVPGLAVALVAAAVHDSGLKITNGYWSSCPNYWNPAMRGILESYLDDLTPGARDALEILALVGLVDLETVRRLVDWEVLELLEGRALVEFVATGPKTLVTVTPPLLVELLRREPLTTRRLRLAELVEEKLGAEGSAAVALADLGRANDSGRTVEALFAQLSRERARTRQVSARSAWQDSPTPQAAVEYLKAIVNTPDARRLVPDVLAKTPMSLADPKALAEYLMVKASWGTFVDHDLTGALAELGGYGDELGPYRRLLDAHTVFLQTHVSQVPTDFPARLEIDESLPTDVKDYLAEVQVLVLTALGRMSDARRVFTLLEEHSPALSTHARILEIYIMLGEGRMSQAHAKALRGFDEAYALLDASSVRAFGYLALLCMMVSGDHTRGESVLETVMTAGENPLLPPVTSRSLQAVASILAFRSGNTATASRLAGQSVSHGLTDGPLPGQAAGLLKAQEIAFEGDVIGAAALLATSSQELWRRGARFAAGLGLLASLDVAWDEERFAECQAWIAEVDTPVFVVQLDYLRAMHAKDAQALTLAAWQLQEAGCLGMAASALGRASVLRRGEGDLAAAASLGERLEELYQRAGTRDLDTSRFATAAVNLTDREREVALLVSEGLANTEIASRLVLSVRTVESHLHRMMRKLDISNRHELGRYVKSSKLS